MAKVTIATILDLQGVLKLQSKNLRKVGSDLASGYVTATHDIDLLFRMNYPFPHSVIKSKEEVVGYALVMLSEMKNEIELLIPMFNLIDTCACEGKNIIDQKYFVMGQICETK